MLLTKKWRNIIFFISHIEIFDNDNCMKSITFWRILLAIYLGIIFYILLFPFPNPKFVNVDFPAKYNFVPFETILQFLRDSVGWSNLIGNILMTIPLFALLHFVFWFKKPSYIFGIWLTVVLGFELVQYLAGVIVGYNFRAIDIDDTLLNVLWYIVWFLIFRLSLLIFKKPLK